jgi:hypothetical protein
MRFELIGKTRAKLCKVENQSKKMGQKELVPAIKVRVMATVPNTVLEMFDPTLRGFLYEKTDGDGKEQKQLEGIEVVSDMPQLRQAGVKLGALHWDEVQTGCTLLIDYGMGGDSNIVLGDCKVDNFKLVPKDGGTTQVHFTLFSTDVDRETLGDIGMLHQHEVEIELTAPVLAQQDLQHDSNPFPVDADEKKAPANPLTPEAALIAAVVH